MNTNLSLTQKLKKLSQRYPQLVAKKREVWHQIFDFNRINVVDEFPAFATTSAGRFADVAAITMQSINETFPALSRYVDFVGLRKTNLDDIKNFPNSDAERQLGIDLRKHLDAYGSDKGWHAYYIAYGVILTKRNEIKNVLEIGMGTNNTDVVSNMGFFGKPGASLRAFRDFLPNADIYGADIDTRILFEEERIKTFYVDQTNPSAFVELGNKLPTDFDLIIDDGLHSPDANLNTMQFALPKIKVGGWFVVEDIALQSDTIWNVIFALLPSNYQPRIFRANHKIFVAIQRIC